MITTKHKCIKINEKSKQIKCNFKFSDYKEFKRIVNYLENY